MIADKQTPWLSNFVKTAAFLSIEVAGQPTYRKEMQLWGITGLMGAGKSQARSYLESKNYPAIDADAVARVLLSAQFPLNLEKLKELFGPQVLKSATEVDRTLIRSQISTDDSLRKKFESWLHPLIRLYNEDLEAQWRKSGAKIAFIEGTRLVESGATERLDGLILVTCDEAIRVERLKARAEMSPEEQSRLAKTQNLELMRKHATLEWDNSRRLVDLKQQIDRFLSELAK